MKDWLELLAVIIISLVIIVLFWLNPIDPPAGHGPSDIARFIWTFG